MITFALRNAAPVDYPDNQSIEHAAKERAPIPPVASMTAIEAAAGYARFVKDSERIFDTTS